MRQHAALVVLIVLGQGASTASAASGSASGPAALALAGVVSAHSSVLGSFDRRAMARLFGGNSAINFPPNRKISVNADSIVCRASDVEITSHICELAFGAGKRMLKGREANELFATLAVAGVASEGAAGSIIEGVTKLACTIDPNEIRQKAGGGAQCSFETGQ
jgi:voltage-gated potassium channel Kch